MGENKTESSKEMKERMEGSKGERKEGKCSIQLYQIDLL